MFSVSEGYVQYSVHFKKCNNVVSGNVLVFYSTGSCLALSSIFMRSLVHPPTSKSCYRVDNSFLMTGDL